MLFWSTYGVDSIFLIALQLETLNELSRPRNIKMLVQRQQTPNHSSHGPSVHPQFRRQLINTGPYTIYLKLPEICVKTLLILFEFTIQKAQNFVSRTCN